jgi:putative hydrolase of the HAD superfamily
MIRAVISDFGGVLTAPLAEAFAASEARTGVSPTELGLAMAGAAEAHGSPPLWNLERGEMSEDEFLRLLEAALPDGGSLRGFGHAWFEQLHPNEPMLELMRDLRARGLRTAILTNNVREWDALWRAKIPDLDAVFEAVVDSAWVGMRKPEPEIYALTVERLGDVHAGECLFVDDLEVNCDAAHDAGMVAVHFTSTEQATAEIEAALAGRPA